MRGDGSTTVRDRLRSVARELKATHAARQQRVIVRLGPDPDGPDEYDVSPTCRVVRLPWVPMGTAMDPDR